MTNLPNFILFSSLITLNVLFTAKSQDIELPTIPLKPLSVKFTSNHSIFSIIISDVNQTFIKNGTADFTDNINANPFCNFTPTTTTFDHLAEFTKDKTQWVTTAIVGDVIMLCSTISLSRLFSLPLQALVSRAKLPIDSLILAPIVPLSDRASTIPTA